MVKTKDALAKMQLGSWEYDIVTPCLQSQHDGYHGFNWFGTLDRYPGLLQRRKKS